MFEFNVSYSLLSVFKESPLRFYFQYIKKNEPDTKVLQSYGIAGNALHDALEEYSNTGKEPTLTLFEKWQSGNLNELPAWNGSPLKIDDYKKMCYRGKQIIDDLKLKGYTIKTELQIVRKFSHPKYDVNIKGYIDVVAYKDDEVIIVDWKSNGSVKSEHKDQQLFYAYLYYNQYGVIPKKFTWHYLKLGKTIEQKNIGMYELKKQHTNIKEFLDFVTKNRDNIDAWDAGDYTNPFNEYRNVCEKVVFERMSRPQQTFNITIKGNYCQLQGDINESIHTALERSMSFTESTAFFKIKAMREKYIKEYIHKNGNDVVAAETYAKHKTEHIGKHCLYKKHSQSFPIGMTEKVKNILQQYGEYKKVQVVFDIVDERDRSVVNNIFPLSDIKSNKTLRPYQEDAIKTFIKKGVGVIEIGTGGGKTFIASHIISKIQRQTVVLVDRIELMDQLHETLSENFNCPIGRIGDGICELEPITIALVQTISRNDVSIEIKEHLRNTAFVVVDEFHKAATEMFYAAFDKMSNVKYRLGLTGTAFRTDGKEMALFGLIGEVIMRVPARELIRMGYLMKPNITFFNVPISQSHKTNNAKDYDASVVNNQWRNDKIKQIVDNNRDKKILILTKLVKKHGSVLKEYIGECMHISSATKRDNRKEIMRQFKLSGGNVLISTTQIASTGLDIEDLDIIINAAGNASEITSVQSLGRVLRTSSGKEEAYYYDFIDGGKFSNRRSYKRVKQFKGEGHEVQLQ